MSDFAAGRTRQQKLIGHLLALPARAARRQKTMQAKNTPAFLLLKQAAAAAQVYLNIKEYKI